MSVKQRLTVSAHWTLGDYVAASLESSKQCAQNKYAVLTTLHNAGVVAINVAT